MPEHNTQTNDTAKRKLSDLQQMLLNDFQQQFPLTSRPFQAIAERLGSTETGIMEMINQLQEQGYISRIGAVFRANSIGSSTLAAMAVPEQRLETVANIINDYNEVNHNYQRDHHFNLWFVVTARDDRHLQAILEEIEQKTGIGVMFLPMLEDYHIDLGFDLKWT